MSEALMLINVVEEEEVRVAICEDDRLQEFYLERTAREHIVGNIYKGKVVNVEPSIEAAFVEFGFERHGFLHASDVKPSVARGKGGKGGKGGKHGHSSPQCHALQKGPLDTEGNKYRQRSRQDHYVEWGTRVHEREEKESRCAPQDRHLSQFRGCGLQCARQAYPSNTQEQHQTRNDASGIST